MSLKMFSKHWLNEETMERLVNGPFRDEYGRIAGIITGYDKDNWWGYYYPKEWVSVEDPENLPVSPYFDWVLVRVVANPEGYPLVPHIAELRNGVWYTQGSNEPLEKRCAVKVTHWMCLPSIDLQQEVYIKPSHVKQTL